MRSSARPLRTKERRLPSSLRRRRRNRGRWAPCERGRYALHVRLYVLLAPPHQIPTARDRYCFKFADRFSTSIVSERVPQLFHSQNGGIIIAPDVVRRGLMCSWASDGRGERAQRTCLAPGERFDFGSDSQVLVPHQEPWCIPGCVRSRELLHPSQRFEDNDTVASGQVLVLFVQQHQAL